MWQRFEGETRGRFLFILCIAAASQGRRNIVKLSGGWRRNTRGHNLLPPDSNRVNVSSKNGNVSPLPESDGPASEVFIRSRAGAAVSSLASITASDDSFFVNLLAFSLIRVFLQDAPPISLHKWMLQAAAKNEYVAYSHHNTLTFSSRRTTQC